MKTMADILRERGKLGPYGQVEKPQPDRVRAWAAENGVDVAPRGPIPAAVLDRYRRETA